VTGLRILFSAAGFYKVGDYFRYKALSERLALAGHSVTVLTGDPRIRLTLETTRSNGVTWLYAPYLGGLRTNERLTAYFPESKLPYDNLYRTYFMARHASTYDVVHGFHVGLNTYLSLLTARRRGRRPVRVFDWCDLWDNGIISPPEKGLLRKLDYRSSVSLERALVRTTDGITVNTTYLAQRAVELGVAPSRLTIVPDGANSDAIHPVDRESVRRRLGLPLDAMLLGFSGFFHPDAELLLKAASRVRARYGHSVKLLMTGSMSSHLVDHIQRENLNDMIIFVGRVDQRVLADYLGACDVLLLPYSGRPINLARWPIKLGDYLSAGRCVVAGAYGEVERFFRKYPDIGIACAGTAEAFADSILALLQDPARRRRGEEAARMAAVEGLSWDKSAVILESFYRDLLQGVSSSRVVG
jgi:glycosyltransferase involved in cell wall biosynthesis